MSASSALQITATDGAAAAEPAPHLLVVDDIADNRTLLTRRFERQGFRVTEADGGLAALRLIEEQTFDLVLLDIMMPDIEGTVVLSEIRSKRSSSTLPVIMVTARAMSDDVVKSLQLGADDYITKPVDFPIALARVKTQLARRKAEQIVRNVAQELSLSKQRLEEKVIERTRDLVRINEQLKEEISHREKTEAEIRYRAHHDALTGLGNRVLFREKVDAAVRELPQEGESCAVLCIDLDGFKTVNDTLGHWVGDELLKEIGARLQSVAPPHATVARLGGDEFAILLPAPATPVDTASLAREVIESAARINTIQGRDVSVGASVGIAYGDRVTEFDELMRRADLALYRSKSDGRGTWRVFDAEMDAVAQARRQLELDLRRALNVGDFELYFQPIVNLKSMRVTCFEALIRWNHATRGVVSPGEFISVAEETGLIVPLGEWAMREACRQAMRWPSEIRVAVNLSPVQLSRGNVVAAIVSALASSGLQADRFEIEITESALLEKTEQTLQTLNQLRSLGVRISMDDFGTGYSSLNYLRSFPFDKIKIDKSFVKDVQFDDDSRAIVAAISELGDRFGLRTTAEGVETTQQLSYVIDRGCSEVQGRLFSMPVPAAEIPALIESIAKTGSDL